MVTYVDFDFGTTFFPETPTKIALINRERNYISRFFKKPQCIPSNDQHTCFVDEQQSSNIFLNPYNLWDMVPAALMSLSHTNDTYSMFNQYPQPTTQQPRTDSYPAFSSLRTMNSKREGLRISFAFFRKNYLPDGRMNKTVAKVEELSDLWSAEQWMEVHRLWWTVVVSKCSYLFHLFDFHCLLVQFLLLFRKLTFFVLFLWWFWVSVRNSLTFSM